MNRVRSRSLSRLVAGLIVASLTAAGGAHAQGGGVKEKHGDWETRCETPPGASYTFHSNCRFVAPNAEPASFKGSGTEAMPRWVSRIGAAMAKITVEIRPGAEPR